MKHTSALLSLVSMAFISATMAIDLPENQAGPVPGQRVLSRKGACQRNLEMCANAVAVEESPTGEWLSLLGEMSTDEDSYLDPVRNIVILADSVDVAAVATSISEDSAIRTLIDTITQLIPIISTIAGALGAAIPDLITAFSAITDLIATLLGLFGAVFRVYGDLFNAILDLISDVFNSAYVGIGRIISFSVGVLSALVDFIGDFIRSILNLFTGERAIGGADSSCSAELMQCSYYKFLASSIPDLVSLSFLGAVST